MTASFNNDTEEGGLVYDFGRVKSVFISHVIASSTLGALLNVLVIVISFKETVLDKTTRLFIVNLAMVDLTVAVVRGVGRYLLYAVPDFGPRWEGVMCSSMYFVGTWSSIMMTLSTHPILLQRYLFMCASPFTLARVFGPPSSCIKILVTVSICPLIAFANAASTFNPSAWNGRSYGGIMCNYAPGPEMFVRILVQLLIVSTLITAHFSLLAFYTVRIVKVLRRKAAVVSQLQQGNADRELNITRFILVSVLVQATAPFVLYIPLFAFTIVIISTSFFGNSELSIWFLVVTEIVYYNPIYDSLAVLIIFKPYRKVLISFIQNWLSPVTGFFSHNKIGLVVKVTSLEVTDK